MDLDDALRRLPAAADRWAQMALDLGAPEMWTAGCVFPTEMAYLFGYCEVLGLTEFIESGRQEGLSTYLLGHFAKRTGTIVHSIDFEDTPSIADACHKRVEGLPLDLLVGDTWQVLGETVGKLKGPTGIFIDGPKHWSAMSLLCAAGASPYVQMISAHNTRPGGNIRQFMQGLSPVPVSYQDVMPGDLPAWNALRARELARLESIGVHGDARTTLAVVPVTDRNRARVAGNFNAHFRLYPPSVVRWAWRGDRHKALSRLVYASYRLFGPEYAPDEQREGAS